MEATIIVFLWIVGALCLFIIAFLTYDLIVRAQDRKAQKRAQASSQEGNPSSSAPAKTSEPAGKQNSKKHPKK